MKNRLYIFLIMGFSIMLISGCGKTVDTPLVEVDASSDFMTYSLVYPAIDSVVRTQRIDCAYMQTREQEVSFNSTGKYVDKVYVKKGDAVKKGDLLCELSSSSLEEEIETLTYKVTRNELLLSYLDTNEELAIQDAWIPAVGNPNIDKSDIEKSVKEIKKDYARRRELLNDSLEFDRLELDSKQSELKSSRLYASMDGIVYSIENKLEGSTTKADEVIMTIVDNTECLFTVNGAEYKDYFTEGQKVNMKISYTQASGDYILEPLNIDKWDDELVFSLYDGPEEAQLEVGIKGVITIETARKDNVLAITKMILHEIEGQYYVYVLNDSNMREIRYIEIGLIGDDNVEILSGLTEGDKVIKK